MKLSHLAELTKSRRAQDSHIESDTDDQTQGRVRYEREHSEVTHAAREAAYLAQVRLGCTLIITGRNA